jgi:hypothetical protein
MPAIDIAAKIRATALAAVEAACLGEDFGFDCTLTVAPQPSGMIAVYTLLVTKRSPLLGQGPLMHASQIPSADPLPVDVERLVTEGMKALRELSGKMLAGQNGQPPLKIALG